MKEKQCGVCLQYFPSMWKSKTKTEPQKCKSCAMKNATPISNYRISTKTESEEETDPKHNGIKLPKTTNLKNNKTIPELLKLATIVFNKWIRQRDASAAYFFCISCSNIIQSTLAQAGHYMPSTYSELRFNEYNVHAECEKCNCNDINHLVGYRKNLISKIGIEKVEWLESHNIANTKKWDRQELLDIISKYK